MVSRGWNLARNGQFGRRAKSAGVRRNPYEYAGTGKIGQEKTPTENGWGFIIGGGRLTAEIGPRSASSDKCIRLRNVAETGS